VACGGARAAGRSSEPGHELAENVLINSSFVPARLAAASGAVLQAGTLINLGASISAEERVSLGQRVRRPPRRSRITTTTRLRRRRPRPQP
jgi:hypothetical protein